MRMVGTMQQRPPLANGDRVPEERGDIILAGAQLLPNAFRCLSRLTVLVLFVVVSDSNATAAHPLDPLSRDEITAAVAVLNKAGATDPTTRFALIDLDEPDKSTVLAWRPDQPIVRKAFVIARQHRTVYEGVVDLGGHTVERWEAIPNVQSSLLAEEQSRAQQITTDDSGWQAAMRRRGYESALRNMVCAPLAAS